VASDQIGIHLFDFLSHEAELRDALGIELFLITEDDWLEREDRFTGLIHRLNVVLEARRGRNRPQAPIAIDHHRDAAGHRCIPDAGDHGFRLGSLLADADGIGLASYSLVANIDVVTAGSKTNSGRFAQS